MRLLKQVALVSLIIVAFTSGLDAWEVDLATADSLLANGYYEAAIEDYQRLLTTYPDQVPVTDRAWFGVARAYQILGNADVTKFSLERVLERNADPTALEGARTLYREMKSEAHLNRSQAEQAKNYYEARYQQTSWLNVITKAFDWFDRRKARKIYEEAKAIDESFNPRYLIDPVATSTPPPAADHHVLSTEELQKLLDAAAERAKAEPEDDDRQIVGDDTPTSEPADTTVGTPPPETISTSPSADLAATRDAYLSAYRSLQDALRDKDQATIQQANEVFQQALAAYRAAQAAQVATQGDQ